MYLELEQKLKRRTVHLTAKVNIQATQFDWGKTDIYPELRIGMIQLWCDL